nr:hypothetical protein [Chamaesiphon sp. OTE_8_metabat_110]
MKLFVQKPSNLGSRLSQDFSQPGLVLKNKRRISRSQLITLDRQLSLAFASALANASLLKTRWFLQYIRT